MTEAQVKCEVAYLKLTYGPGIRYKRKVGKKFVNFSVDELRSQIRDVLSPNMDLTTDLGTAIKNVLL